MYASIQKPYANKIRMALIELATEIEEQVESNPALIKKDTDTPNIQQNHYGSGDNILGDKIINS